MHHFWVDIKMEKARVRPLGVEQWEIHLGTATLKHSLRFFQTANN